MAKTFLKKDRANSNMASDYDWGKDLTDIGTDRELTVNHRIEKLIFELRLNKKDFALSIGKDPSVITQMVQGRNKPGFDVLEKILKTYPNVSSDWLMKAEGEMFKKSENEVLDAVVMPSANNAGMEWAKKLIAQQEREINRLWSIIEKAGLGKPKVSPLLTAIAPNQKIFVPGAQFRVHQLSN